MKTLALILALLVAGPAGAEELTGGDLYSFCGAKDEVARAACRFYVLGVVQGIELGDGAVMGEGRGLVAKKKTIFCAPDDMPVSQLVDIFQQSMNGLRQTYPGDFKLPAVGLIGATMVRAYPCPT